MKDAGPLIAILTLIAAFLTMSGQSSHKAAEETRLRSAQIEQDKCLIQKAVEETRLEAAQIEQQTKLREHQAREREVRFRPNNDLVVTHADCVCKGQLTHVSVRYTLRNTSARTITATESVLNFVRVGIVSTPLRFDRAVCNEENLIWHQVQIDVPQAKPGVPIRIPIELTIPPGEERRLAIRYWFNNLRPEDRSRLVADGHVTFQYQDGECISRFLPLGGSW